MSNLELWNRVSKTDPKHVKPITGKQYSGNSPKPHYIVMRLTEEFGPIGEGWGFDIVHERFERLSEHDVLHVAKVQFWHGERSQSFQQMGQTKAAYMTSKGTLLVDEDAPKKSVTDALVKCASYLGFAGDIFMGMWDDSKYVNELRKEFAEAGDLKDKLKQSIELVQTTRGASLPDKRRKEMDNLALEITEAHERGQEGEVVRYWFDPRNFENNEEKLYLWGHLAPPIHTLIKANDPNREQPKKPEGVRVVTAPGLKKTFVPNQARKETAHEQ